MCFIRSLYENYNCKTAKEDIVCFKILKRPKKGKAGKYKAPFMDFTYNLNRTKTYSVPKFTYGIPDRRFIYAGIHTHVYRGQATYQKSNDEVIKECIIPKGTRYYENRYEYVSLKIKIIK